MVARDRVSIAIEPGSFDSVVLRREGLAVAVLTRERPPPPPPRGEPWVPPPLPPPARALRVALVDGLVNEVLGTPVDDLRTIESASLDVPLAARATPETTVFITIHGTNLVDFDDEDLSRQLRAADEVGAGVVIRLVE